MPDPLLIEALGHRFEVDVTALPADQVAALRLQWARCAPDEQELTPVADRPRVPLSDIDDPVRRDYALSSSVTFSAIRQAAGSGVMLHACGVATDSGDVAVLVAASGTGKTTAAARLCAREFGYVTDETVLVRGDLSVVPYPKPLSVVLEADDPHHKQQYGPDELHLRIPPPRLTARALLLLDRVDRDNRDAEPADPDAAPALEPVGLIDAMMTLIPHTSSLTALDRPLTALAQLISDLGGVQTLRYREIDETGDLIRRALRAGGNSATEFTSVSRSAGAPPADSDGRVQRAPFDDAIVADDEVLLLAGSVPLRLSALGATIWLAAAGPVSDHELVDICQSVHGEHPDAADLVHSAISELLGVGALVVGHSVERVSA
ncbi:hypothetical protein ATK17_0079 [Branchiibius hedensis]|uniref:Coenzyme PQQ synthesis protein D (PqqD) n=1 Tax=Branchiibius hedensis TaxID=672460 RepID=A0A2Y8ZM17_9MICO|nr:hypothetical protein [Branchiibius hedensis]PWJ23996.1 hypothetical protein ATK17_0079 [Branchiibius hedensis]SSA32814.1 hypothetical protein SAMN04489750_0079 [Branchiibius hedensis]